MKEEADRHDYFGVPFFDYIWAQGSFMDKAYKLPIQPTQHIGFLRVTWTRPGIKRISGPLADIVQNIFWYLSLVYPVVHATTDISGKVVATFKYINTLALTGHSPMVHRLVRSGTRLSPPLSVAFALTQCAHVSP